MNLKGFENTKKINYEISKNDLTTTPSFDSHFHLPFLAIRTGELLLSGMRPVVSVQLIGTRESFTTEGPFTSCVRNAILLLRLEFKIS